MSEILNILNLLKNNDRSFISSISSILKSLEDVVDIIKGISIPFTMSYDFNNKNYIRYIRQHNIRDGKVIDKELAYVNINELRKNEATIVKENDVLISIRGNIGKLAYVNKKFVNSLISSDLTILRSKDNLDSYYLYYVLSSDYIQKQLQQLKIGGNRINAIYLHDLKKIDIPVPQLSSQNEIVRITERNKEINNQGGNMDELDHHSVFQLINEGESDKLEFKSSLRTPIRFTDSITYKQNILKNKIGNEKKSIEQAITNEIKILTMLLEHEVYKTIAAFMNSDGGILFIGVNDNGKILGIEPDFMTFGDKKNWDGWSQHFINLIRKHIGIDSITCIKLRNIIIDNKMIAIINVKKSPKPIYVEFQDSKGNNKIEFYIRAINTTQTLDVRQIVDYITRNW